MEPVYGTVIQLARLTWRVQGLKFTITGLREPPAHNQRRRRRDQPHQLFRLHLRRTAGLPQGHGRRVRFMAKQGGVRQQGHRADHAQAAPHSGRPRTRRLLIRGGFVRLLRRASWSASIRGDHQPQLRTQTVQIGRRPNGHRGQRADRAAHRLGRAAHLDQGSSTQDVAPRRSPLRSVSRSRRHCPPTSSPLCCIRGCSTCSAGCRTPTESTRGRILVPHRLGGGAPTLAEAAQLDAEGGRGTGSPSRGTKQATGYRGIVPVGPDTSRTSRAQRTGEHP